MRAGSPYRLIIDVLEYDARYAPAVERAAGSTVLAENLTDARRLRFENNVAVKVVTIDGSSIARNGNMTGGDSDSVPKGTRWDEKEIEELEVKRKVITQHLTELKRKLRPTSRSGSQTHETVITVGPTRIVYAIADHNVDTLLCTTRI